jgi:hypothetical protein
MPNSFMVKALDKINILYSTYVGHCSKVEDWHQILPTIQADEKLPFRGGHQGFGKWTVNIGEGWCWSYKTTVCAKKLGMRTVL